MIHISKRTMWRTSKISDLRKKSGSGTLVCATIAAKAVSESVNVRIIKTQKYQLYITLQIHRKRETCTIPLKIALVYLLPENAWGWKLILGGLTAGGTCVSSRLWCWRGRLPPKSWDLHPSRSSPHLILASSPSSCTPQPSKTHKRPSLREILCQYLGWFRPVMEKYRRPVGGDKSLS